MGVDAPSTIYYFVDEAGDPTLFSTKGKTIVGKPGCSRWFMLGLLEVPDPAALSLQMESLRRDLLTDPYFTGVPSFDPRQNKTAVAFHAKDDLPEVRREVFALLRKFPGLRFLAVVKDKLTVVEYVRSRQKRNPGYRYRTDELYDLLVRRLTKKRLHKAPEYIICFASRGRKDRTEALRTELLKAREHFIQAQRYPHTSNLYVRSCPSKQNTGLQAVDYFLWALQRLYTRGEERYWNYVWPSCKLIIDIDDTREHPYGMYYTQKKPLTKAALSERIEWN